MMYSEAHASEARFPQTGKERDSESGLDYFGARYFAFDAIVEGHRQFLQVMLQALQLKQLPAVDTGHHDGVLRGISFGHSMGRRSTSKGRF